MPGWHGPEASAPQELSLLGRFFVLANDWGGGMVRVDAVVIRERVETVIDAVEEATGHVGVTVVEAIVDSARSGNESGDGLTWTTTVSNVTHNRSGRLLEEVEVGA